MKDRLADPGKLHEAPSFTVGGSSSPNPSQPWTSRTHLHTNLGLRLPALSPYGRVAECEAPQCRIGAVFLKAADTFREIPGLSGNNYEYFGGRGGIWTVKGDWAQPRVDEVRRRIATGP